LIYRTDVPQEGRIRGAPGEVEMRLSTFPTLHGEKAVVRLFAGSGRFLRLADLGLPAEVHDALSQVLDETSGAGILSGPAGSGKTTSLYAKRKGALQYLAAWDVHRGIVLGRCEAKTGIKPFGRLVDQVIEQEPYHDAER
jgi:type II secretory ATPase GspE/PulE/Tfp pilus assembly ATPase PilB-like protein